MSMSVEVEEKTYSIGITSPSPDILLDPFKGFYLIFETEVGSSVLGDLVSVPSISLYYSYRGDSPETKNTESIVDGDYDHRFLLFISFTARDV